MGNKLQVASGKWIIPLFMLAGYCILPFWFPLIPHYREELADVLTFAPSLGAGVAYAGLLLCLFGLNWGAAEMSAKVSWSFPFILLTTCLFSLPLLFAYPINANDVFRYFLRGRLVAEFGASPYLVPPSALPDGAYTHLAGEWANAVSPYGSVWEGIDALVVWGTGGSLLAALLIFKLIGVLSVLGVGWLIFELTNKEIANAILWLWNPAVLYMLVIDAHNDGVVLFWILLGAWVWKKYDRPTTATLIMVLAPLTKLSGIVPLPFFGLTILRSLPDLKTRIRYIVLSSIGTGLLVFITFLPFGSPLDLFERLLSESKGGGGFSPLVFIHFMGQRIEGLEIDIWQWISWGTSTFVLLSGGLLLWGREAWRSSAESYYIYLATAFKFRIWYTLWLFPFALISDSFYHRRAAYLLLLTSQLSVIIYGHLRIHLFGGDHAIAHFIAVPLTFLFPLLAPLLIQKHHFDDIKPT